MRLPGVLDATVRYLVLTVVGAVLLLLVPVGAMGAPPIWIVAGRPGPTLAHLFGIAVVLAAWAYFAIVVVVLRAVRRPDAWVIGSLTVDLVAVAVAVFAFVLEAHTLGLALLALATAAQLAIAAGAGGRFVRKARSGTGASRRLR